MILLYVMCCTLLSKVIHCIPYKHRCGSVFNITKKMLRQISTDIRLEPPTQNSIQWHKCCAIGVLVDWMSAENWSISKCVPINQKKGQTLPSTQFVYFMLLILLIFVIMWPFSFYTYPIILSAAFEREIRSHPTIICFPLWKKCIFGIQNQRKPIKTVWRHVKS